jgi:hypothetical protein
LRRNEAAGAGGWDIPGFARKSSGIRLTLLSYLVSLSQRVAICWTFFHTAEKMLHGVALLGDGGIKDAAVGCACLARDDVDSPGAAMAANVRHAS